RVAGTLRPACTRPFRIQARTAPLPRPNLPSEQEGIRTLRGALLTPRRVSTSSLRVHPATAHHSRRVGDRDPRGFLGSCGQLWAPSAGWESDRTLEVGGSTPLGSTC